MSTKVYTLTDLAELVDLKLINLPENTIEALATKVESIVAGSGIEVDIIDPINPVVSLDPTLLNCIIARNSIQTLTNSVSQTINVATNYNARSDEDEMLGDVTLTLDLTGVDASKMHTGIIDFEPLITQRTITVNASIGGNTIVVKTTGDFTTVEDSNMSLGWEYNGERIQINKSYYF